jgi:hypothetical protein
MATRSRFVANIPDSTGEDFIDLSVSTRKPYLTVAAGSKASFQPQEHTSDTSRTNAAEVILQKENEWVGDLQGQVADLLRHLKAANDKVNRLHTDVDSKQKEKDALKQAGKAAVTVANEMSRERNDLKKQLAVHPIYAEDLSNHIGHLQARYNKTKQDKADLDALLASRVLEVDRLCQERSAHASLAPASSKTEEEYLRDIQSISQKVKDLLHHMAMDLTPRKVLAGSRKEQRIHLQHFLHRRLWSDLFHRVLTFLSDEKNQLMLAIWTGIDECPCRDFYLMILLVPRTVAVVPCDILWLFASVSFDGGAGDHTTRGCDVS